jgi:hypothetical protein
LIGKQKDIGVALPVKSETGGMDQHFSDWTLACLAGKISLTFEWTFSGRQGRGAGKQPFFREEYVCQNNYFQNRFQ